MVSTTAVFIILVILFLIASGFYSIIKGRPLGKEGEAAKKYTEESYKKYNRLAGIFYILGGIFIACYEAHYLSESIPEFVKWIGVAGAIVCVCAVIALYLTIPKTSDQD